MYLSCIILPLRVHPFIVTFNVFYLLVPPQLFIYRTLILTAAPSLSKLHKHSQLTYFRENFDDIHQIGEGSFGEVFRVRCKETGLYYAVKRSKERFRSEYDRLVNKCTYFIVVMEDCCRYQFTRYVPPLSHY